MGNRVSTRSENDLKVACTGVAGVEHNRRELAVFVAVRSLRGEWTVAAVESVSLNADRELQLTDTRDDMGDIDDLEAPYRERFRLRCPSCPRDEQWLLETAEHIVLTLLKAGVRSIDLRHLPANVQSS